MIPYLIIEHHPPIKGGGGVQPPLGPFCAIVCARGGSHPPFCAIQKSRSPPLPCAIQNLGPPPPCAI